MVLIVIGLRCLTIYGVEDVEIILEWVCLEQKSFESKKDYSLSGYFSVLYGLCMFIAVRTRTLSG